LWTDGRMYPTDGHFPTLMLLGPLRGVDLKTDIDTDTDFWKSSQKTKTDTDFKNWNQHSCITHLYYGHILCL